MRIWSKTTLKSLLIPGGLLLASVSVLVYSGWLTMAQPALSFLYYCAIVGGMLLAWRFHSVRIFFALVVLFLAEELVTAFGPSHVSPGSPAWTALTAAAVLLPLDYVLIALMQERGFTVAAAAPVAVVLFAQTVIVTVLCRAAEGAAIVARGRHAAVLSLPGYAVFAFVAGGIVLLIRFLLTRKPADSAFLWALGAFFLSLRFVQTPTTSTLYAATAACTLAVSIIENSYLLAYHDELTTLPSRRAFNDAVMRLQEPYSIAVVDIDHFKKFNDTYGHDTGDQVLCMVASCLSRVTGGGQAYRCGGEEFNIVFPGKTTAEVADHLEHLRGTVEASEFRLRGGDRRRASRGIERRSNRTSGRSRKGQAIRELMQDKPHSPLSVTVSIGVATSGKESDPDLVLQAADKALYRAKENGRNRVETSMAARRTRVKSAGIA